MIVRHEAFDELLDRAALAEEEGEALGRGVERRRQFALEIDRAVKRVLARVDERIWHTHTMKRFACRLHFFRREDRVYLVACSELDGEEAVTR